MELKVWVEGIQRIVCGVTDKTTCQDVVYALAHATGKTGRFTLIERLRNNERLLAPQEHPLKVLQKWGEYSQDVQFILQRSALDGAKGTQQNLRSKEHQKHNIKDKQPPAAVWKPPPGQQQQQQQQKSSRNNLGEQNHRLSPDSGRGSDRTGGSDTSNGFNSDKELMMNQQRRGFPPPTSQQHYNGYAHHPTPTFNQPPAYRPPPAHNNASPAEYPPPYRNPPPPPNNKRYPTPSSMNGQPSFPSSSTYQQASSQGVVQPVRPPHYSPPPTHRGTHLSRHPSRTSLSGAAGVGTSSSTSSFTGHTNTSRMNQHGLPSRQIAAMPSSRVRQVNYSYQEPSPPTDLAELVQLVSAQQSTLYSQQHDIKQFEAETSYLENISNNGSLGPSPFPVHQQQQHHGPYPPQQTTVSTAMPPSNSSNNKPESQIDLVISEVRRLEEVANRNEEELGALGAFNANSNSLAVQKSESPAKDDFVIKNEISLLKQRLAGTDHELHKTNTTLRRLGDEMRSMSIEKSRQREKELIQEIERLQNDIKGMQKSSEEGANISQQLSKEVKEVEEQISQRKSEVEKLIKEMREANMESLTISPPEESKQFLDGPMKPGTVRKMTGSPRALESAVPTAKNPHGVWV